MPLQYGPHISNTMQILQIEKVHAELLALLYSFDFVYSYIAKYSYINISYSYVVYKKFGIPTTALSD